MWLNSNLNEVYISGKVWNFINSNEYKVNFHHITSTSISSSSVIRIEKYRFAKMFGDVFDYYLSAVCFSIGMQTIFHFNVSKNGSRIAFIFDSKRIGCNNSIQFWLRPTCYLMYAVCIHMIRCTMVQQKGSATCFIISNFIFVPS